jgi:predicted nucleic acid-binding Zn ribbon protein
MPFFKYLVLNKGNTQEYIEVEQSLTDAPLVEHPLTGKPIKRIIDSPSLTLRHSSLRENKILSADNLQKHGFSVLEKNESTAQYVQTIGDKLDLEENS